MNGEWDEIRQLIICVCTCVLFKDVYLIFILYINNMNLMTNNRTDHITARSAKVVRHHLFIFHSHCVEMH